MQLNRKYIITFLLGLTMLFRFMVPAFGGQGHCDRMLSGDSHKCCMAQPLLDEEGETVLVHAGCGCQLSSVPDSEDYKSSRYTHAPSPRFVQEVACVLSLYLFNTPNSEPETPVAYTAPFRSDLSSRHKLALFSTLLI